MDRDNQNRLGINYTVRIIKKTNYKNKAYSILFTKDKVEEYIEEKY